MQVTEVRMKILDTDYYSECEPPVLRAVFSLVLDNCMVLHGLKLIETTRGSFLAMPNERKTDRCPDCARKNPVMSRYCGHCGVDLPDNKMMQLQNEQGGKARYFIDTIHPLTKEFRDYLTDACRSVYRKELACPGSTLPLTTHDVRSVG